MAAAMVRNCKLWRRNRTAMVEGVIIEYFRNYGSRSNSNSKWKVDFKKLRPMILKRIEERAKEYPVNSMIPVAQEVVKARAFLINGVSTLLHFIPVWACKYCTEVYIGEEGHTIRTCRGYRRGPKHQVHKWVKAGLNDILVPVETFHLHNMFQNVIKHEERFDYERVPAVIELSLQAGADPNDESVASNSLNLDSVDAESLSAHDLTLVASGTLRAWETLRSGVKRLLLVYPTKVCKYCSEVHVGPSGHKARLCGIFDHEGWRGTHFWEKAEVDDLVPPKHVWFRRPQDPPVLLNEGRNYYGHAPAVVDLCTKAGVIAPSKYFCMMKMQGSSAPVEVKPNSIAFHRLG